MAAIDRTDFAKECVTQGTAFGAWAHYLVAVAKLRSKIDDAPNGNQFGPFMLTQQQWDAYIGTHADLGLASDEIKEWDAQCLYAASWTHEVHKDLVTATGQNPSSKEIYAKQFPGDPTDGLDQALTDTSGLMPHGEAVAISNTPLDLKPSA